MNNIYVQKLDNNIEGLIITGMIVDTGFYRETKRATNPRYFDSDQAKILATWIHDYAEYNNEESPGDQIKEIYEANIHDLTEDESKTMRIFLNNTLQTYAGKKFNSSYISQKAFPYLEEKAYSHKIKQAELMLRKGDLESVKNIFEKINENVFQETTQWKSFSNTEAIYDWWWMKQQSAMTFQGELGRYMPPIYHGKLYAMLGPMKRGKTFWLWEWAINGVMDGLNTTVFSLEMTNAECHERWLSRISGKEIMEKKRKEYKIPVVDCVHNQTGLCQMDICKSPETIVANEKGEREEYENNTAHKPCTVCRDDVNGEFLPTTWFIEKKIERLSIQEAVECQEDFDTQYEKDKFKFITFPIGTASVQDIENSLNDLERRENFITDLVVIDYADIMQKEGSNRDLRFKLRDLWEELSRLAKTRNCIVVTASQGNRNSIYKDRLKVDDIAEDISKIATIDGIFAINEEGLKSEHRKKKDNYWMVQRIETLMLRYSSGTNGRQCICLNDRARGQICLDSYII
jgi:hypothetical protein